MVSYGHQADSRSKWVAPRTAESGFTIKVDVRPTFMRKVS